MEISFRCKAHVCHLLQTVFILLVNLLLLILSILVDLIHSLHVVSLQRFNLLIELLDLSLLGIDEVLVVSLELIDLLSMLFKDAHLDGMELSLLFVMLVEEGLIASSIFKHSLRVLSLLLFHLDVMLVTDLLDLSLELLFKFILDTLSLLDLISDELLLVTKIILESVDVLLVS